MAKHLTVMGSGSPPFSRQPSPSSNNVSAHRRLASLTSERVSPTILQSRLAEVPFWVYLDTRHGRLELSVRARPSSAMAIHVSPVASTFSGLSGFNKGSTNHGGLENRRHRQEAVPASSGWRRGFRAGGGSSEPDDGRYWGYPGQFAPHPLPVEKNRMLTTGSTPGPMADPGPATRFETGARGVGATC
jgi:hypothetical protein